MAELVGAGNGSVSHSLVLVSSDEPLVVSARCAVCIRIVYVHVLTKHCLLSFIYEGCGLLVVI